MTVEDPPFVLQSDAHPAKVFRHLVQALFGSPVASHTPTAVVTTGGGGNGVAGAADLVVTANGTPNMTVNVSSGLAFVRGSEAADQGIYAFHNDATVNLAIGTANGSNPRDDIIVAQVRDAGGGYSGASNDARLFVVAGTPAAVPADPTLPVNCIALARVRVGTSVTSIVTGNITDLRRRAYTVGGRAIVTSTTRPTGAALFDGLEIYETDTDQALTHDGANFLPPDNVAAGAQGRYAQVVANQTGISTEVDITGLTITFTALAGRRYRISGYMRTQQLTTASDTQEIYITTGANVKIQISSLVGTLNGFNVHQPAVILVPGAGSVTYKLRGASIATMSILADVIYPAYILVEDIGV